MKAYKGITLVALIITIAVLIIITAVSIKAFGDSENGIIAKAKNASKDYKQSETQEKDTLKNILDQINEEDKDKEKEEEIKKEKLLPDEYQGVEYIESTGTQYIDTGYYYTDKDSLNIDFMPKSNKDKALFGSYSSNDSVGRNRIVISNELYYTFNGLEQQSIDYIFESVRALYSNGSQGFKIDNNTIATYSNYASFTSLYSAYILTSNSNGKPRQSETLGEPYAIGLLYRFYISRNNKLIRNFIPCYHKSNGVIGMYDTVEGKFYTNQGTGEFLKGPDVDYEKE